MSWEQKISVAATLVMLTMITFSAEWISDLNREIAMRDATIAEDGKTILTLEATALTTSTSLTDCSEKLRQSKEDHSL